MHTEFRDKSEWTRERTSCPKRYEHSVTKKESKYSHRQLPITEQQGVSNVPSGALRTRY